MKKIMKLHFKKQLSLIIAIMMVAFITTSVTAQKKYKNTTDIPANITTQM